MSSTHDNADHDTTDQDTRATAEPGSAEIRLLPDEVVDQIAAGEVVERPASVVKELVENALDAGASNITVEVEQGGKRMIRVVDNGCGMSAESVRRALMRHATSKLTRLDDIFSLTTMGFRGEALPSIASVSRMVLSTRSRACVAGTRLEIEGGTIVDESEIGAPVGTQIEIRDLLFNVPARLKFLKGNATEASHVTDAVTRLAMANPGVHMRLRHGSRTSLEAPAHRTRLERVKAVLGSRFARRIHPVAGEEDGIDVEAYLTAPSLAQATGRGVQIYVGRRPIKDRGLLQAITMGYGELLPKGRYPVVVVFVDVPGGTVDVNVHPQKQEVRFSDSQAVYAAVRHTVRRGVAEAPWLADGPEQGASPVRMKAIASSRPPRDGSRPESSGRPGVSALAVDHADRTTRSLFEFDGRGRPIQPETRDAPPGAGIRKAAFPLAPEASTSAAATRAESPGVRRGSKAWSEAARVEGGRGAWARAGEPGPIRPYRAGTGRPGPVPAPGPAEMANPVDPADPPAEMANPVNLADRPVLDRLPSAATSHAGQPGPAAPAPAQTPEAGRSAGTFFTDLNYIGQLDRTYLVCESAGEMVLVDQHAAHERVAFQRLRERYQKREIPVQRMLFAQTVELTGDQAAVAIDHADDLVKMGFELEPFGGTTFALKTVPSGLRQGDAPDVLVELLSELAERGGSRALEERLDLALATIACHSVVRAGDTLSTQEVDSLFLSLDAVDFKAHCPHGRPVLLRISIGEIARRFGRT